jgi:type I restriction enzyme S subunit
VPAPEYDEQAAVASVLADMGAELTALEARREETRQLRQGMMPALLTGRIRLA